MGTAKHIKPHNESNQPDLAKHMPNRLSAALAINQPRKGSMLCQNASIVVHLPSDLVQKVLTSSMSTQEWTKKNASIVVLHRMVRALRAQVKHTNTEVAQINVSIAVPHQLAHVLRALIRSMRNNEGVSR